MDALALHQGVDLARGLGREQIAQFQLWFGCSQAPVHHHQVGEVEDVVGELVVQGFNQLGGLGFGGDAAWHLNADVLRSHRHKPKNVDGGHAVL